MRTQSVWIFSAADRSCLPMNIWQFLTFLTSTIEV